MKRAIALAGGGPAVGLTIGALRRLHEEPGVKFDVWTTSCIGAWCACIWNQAEPGNEAAHLEERFRDTFRMDDEYDCFPIAPVFAPNFKEISEAMIDFVMSPASYNNLIVPRMMKKAADEVWAYARTPSKWSPGNLNNLIFNHMMAPNPMVRFLVSMIYKSENTGLAQFYYDNSDLTSKVDFKKLYEPGKPKIYHNAFNLDRRKIEIFSNQQDNFRNIDGRSVCGGSSLPYFARPVEIDGETFCEGATIEVVSFAKLLETDPDIDEVWISRILDLKQVQKPKNLIDAMNNLVIMFASELSERDVEAFKDMCRERGREVPVIEIHVPSVISHHWNRSNFEQGMLAGYTFADIRMMQYKAERQLDDLTQQRRAVA